VELDPEVARMAHRYFGLDKKDARIFLMDARRYFRTTKETYDLIIMDAFGSSSIPFHLVTREAFQALAGHLAPDGVLVVNTETVGWDDPLVPALTATMGEQFRNIFALPTAEPPNALGNMVFLASNRAMEIPEADLGNPYDYLPEPYMHWAVVQRIHAWDNRFVPKTAGAHVMTDDLNPVDLWAEGINRASRKDLHELFGKNGMDW
jgi:spermidine synthase